MARDEDGVVVFVRHALPGERVVARITGEASSYRRADAVEVLALSPDRVEPPCSFAGPGRCGGCDWQHVALPAQRVLKADLVAEQLRRVAGMDRTVTVEEVPGAPDGLGWRSRVRFAVDGDGRAGFRRHRSHAVEVVDRCLLATPEVVGAGVEQHRWPGAGEVEVFAAAGEPPVVSVRSGPGRFRARPDVDTGMVVDGKAVRDPVQVHFEVLGRHFRVSAGAFWQVHPGAATVLGQAVLAALDPQPGDRAGDLYAGAGLFASLLGHAVGPTGRVLAIERDARACADAVRNTADQPQVRIRRATVTPQLVGGGLGASDLVVLDPARQGAGKAVMAALTGLDPAPRRVAYVSCDPASFARDLRVATTAGWELASLRAFDLFPMTEHVELVALLVPPGG